jgi:hypothetical protein
MEDGQQAQMLAINGALVAHQRGWRVHALEIVPNRNGRAMPQVVWIMGTALRRP